MKSQDELIETTLANEQNITIGEIATRFAYEVISQAQELLDVDLDPSEKTLVENIKKDGERILNLSRCMRSGT